MTTKNKMYKRYEKIFVAAYGVTIGLILILTHFPGSIELNTLGLYKLAAAAVLFNVVFYFMLPERFIGRIKTIVGVLFAVFFITMVLLYSQFDRSPFFFLYFLVILTAAIYLGPRETIVVAVLIISCYLMVARLAGREPFSLTPSGILHLINTASLVMVAFFASVLSRSLKQRERQARSRAQRLAALTVLTQSVVSSLEDQKVFQQVVESISKLLNVPICFLWTLDADENALTACAGHTTQPLPPSANHLTVGEGLVGWVAANRQTIALTDVLQDSRTQFREVAKGLGFVGYLAVPLIFSERLFGVLEIGTPEQRRFTQEEIDIVQSFAAQSAIALNNSRLFRLENERSQRLVALKKFRDVIQMAIEPDEVSQALTQTLKREFDLEQIVIMKQNPSANRLEVKETQVPLAPDFRFSVLNEPMNCLALRSSRRFVMNNQQEDYSCPQNCHEGCRGSYLCLPLIVGGSVTGVAHLQAKTEDYWNSDRMSHAESFVDQTAPILASLNLLQQAQQRAISDPLTGLYNRRFLFEFMQQQITQSKRYNQPLSVLMLDLDHFKEVNDTYGHESGDLVLKLFALRLRENLRESDMAARYGGEEFVIVLPNTGFGGAMSWAEKIRQLALGTSISQILPDLPHIAVSIGVATYPLHGESVEQLQRASDAALYKAKQSGRNRVVAAEPLHSTDITERPRVQGIA
ncbi:MAG: diguanylate cyclase [Acidobacteriia bacterium]|nr:diguanylate cyclase [Terriglobia bacterium]